MVQAAMPVHFAILVVVTTFLIINAYPALLEAGSVKTPFSYLGATGPDKWGTLTPEFSACSNGKLQSPIDIVRDKVVRNNKLKPLARRYKSVNATLINNGFNIEMQCGKNSGLLKLDGKTYKFKEMHWHSPSEHRIDGIQYAAELHLVHISDDGSIAVVGVLYRLGRADRLITKIQKKLYELAEQKCGVHKRSEVALGEISLKQLKKNSRKYYRYCGSLTTPPCTEPVVWHILRKVRSISRKQMQALKAPLRWNCKNNSRPVQSLNGRLVMQR